MIPLPMSFSRYVYLSLLPTLLLSTLSLLYIIWNKILDLALDGILHLTRCLPPLHILVPSGQTLHRSPPKTTSYICRYTGTHSACLQPPQDHFGWLQFEFCIPPKPDNYLRYLHNIMSRMCWMLQAIVTETKLLRSTNLPPLLHNPKCH